MDVFDVMYLLGVQIRHIRLGYLPFWFAVGNRRNVVERNQLTYWMFISYLADKVGIFLWRWLVSIHYWMLGNRIQVEKNGRLALNASRFKR